MTDENQNQEDVIGDLYEDDNVEEAHDPANAPEQARSAVAAAGNAAPTAKKRKGDKPGSDKMQKVAVPSGQDGRIDDKGASPFKESRLTKAGMINNAYQKMSSMRKEDLAALYAKVMMEDSEEETSESETVTVKANVDWSEDLNALVESEATLSDEFKSKAGTIMEAAINSRLAEEIDALEEKFNEELAAEIKETKEGLVDKVDSYLNYVVENWMEENKVAIHNGLRTEIAEDFMNKMKDVFIESYIEVPESKVDLVDDLAAQVEDLEEKLNETTGKAISVSEELENLKRDAIIREASKDLAETQVEKLKSLTHSIDYESEENFIEKVKTVKESYFKVSSPAESTMEDLDEDTSDDTVEVSGSMASYISAIKKTAKPT